MNKKKDTLIAEYRHFRVYHEKVTIEGIEKTFEYVWRRDGTRTIAINQDSEILLTKEFRFELQREDWRIPGGRLDDENEPIIDAAKREFKEETGYTAKNWSYLWSSTPDSTVRYQRHFLLASDLTEGETSFDLGEEISAHWIPIDKVVEMAIKGGISEEISALSIIRLCYQIKEGDVSI